MVLLRTQIVALTLLLASLAGTSAHADGTRSYQQTFDAPYMLTKETAMQSLSKLGLSHDKTVFGEVATIMYFSRPATAYSWGESGAVTVHNTGPDRTRVDVTSQKAVLFQITGKSTRTFAREIFDTIASDLTPN